MSLTPIVITKYVRVESVAKDEDFWEEREEIRFEKFHDAMNYLTGCKNDSMTAWVLGADYGEIE